MDSPAVEVVQGRPWLRERAASAQREAVVEGLKEACCELEYTMSFHVSDAR